LNKNISTTQHLATLSELGVQALPFGSNDIRMITHLNFDDDMLEHTIKVLRQIS
jgi:hypothetical protein